MLIGTNQAPVQGFSLMEVNGDKKLVGQFVEFNSLAWSIDTGVSGSPSQLLEVSDLYNRLHRD